MSSRESLEAAQHGWEQAVGVLLRRAEVAEAEARALRAALELIAASTCDAFQEPGDKTCRELIAVALCDACIARDALKAAGPEHEERM